MTTPRRTLTPADRAADRLDREQRAVDRAQAAVERAGEAEGVALDVVAEKQRIAADRAKDVAAAIDARSAAEARRDWAAGDPALVRSVIEPKDTP